MHHKATFRKRLSPKDGFCGTLWDICPCLLLMFLCRRMWISCRMSCSSWQQLLVVPEPVVEVPKISPHDIPPRRWCRDTQLAEQLVEVPTIRSFSSLFQRSVEEHVDIPVPGGGGPSSGLQGFSSGQSSTASPSKIRISERIVEQIVRVFFALFPVLKKVRTWLRTRGWHCSPSRAHPRPLLSWRAPSSGYSSGTATLGRPTTGTDVLSVLSGSHRLASRSCRSAKGMRREGSGTGTGTRVSLRLTSLLFLLSEELHRQPRAVFKYWAPCRLCWDDTYAVGWFLCRAPRIWQSLVRCSPWFDRGYMLHQSTAASVEDC